MLPSNDQSSARFYAVPSFVPNWGWAEFLIAIRCILSGRVVRGRHVARLLEIVRDRLGLPHALAVNRARYGIQLALEALEVGPGDDVVVPSYVCDVLLEPIRNVGADPVFADVGDDLHVTPETVRKAITDKTRCVIVPHLFGNAAPIDEIETMLEGTGIHLIDDAAQSFGVRCAGRPVGTFGICGVVGLGPGKSLSGPAGGVLVTRDPELFERAASRDLPDERRMSVFRRYGAFWVWFRFRRFFLGFKSASDQVLPQENKSGDSPGRMSNLDAGLAIRQIAVWERNAERRKSQARKVLQAIGVEESDCGTDLSATGVALRLVLVLPEDSADSESTLRFLMEKGIEARYGYLPLHTLGADRGNDLPVTESLAERAVLVPISDRLVSRPRLRQALRQVFGRG